MSRARAAVVCLVVMAGTLGVPTSSAAQTGSVVRDVLYATHGGEQLMLDAYLPDDDGPSPAVVVIPGGRWIEADRAKHSDVPEYFAEHGIAAFVIEYRSALSSPYPAAVEDVRAAIHWVRTNASEYDIDPEQLGAVGVSAGGQLAALAAASGSGPTTEGARVRVVASWSGPMDLRPLVDSSDGDLRETVRRFLGCSNADPCSDVAAEASPITHVDPSDPPMILVNSEAESIPADQAVSMGEALTAAGVESMVRIGQGGHGAGYGGGTKVLDEVIPFLQAWIAGRPAPTTGSEGDGDGGGKGTDQPATTVAPGAEDRAAGDARAGTTSTAVVAAMAMSAIIVVMALLFVIVRLRRRIVLLSSGPESPGPTPEES